VLGQVDFASNDNDAFYRSVDELRKTSPTSPWLELALLSAANLHLVHHEYDQALDAYREMQQRFPNGTRASYAHWKAAWLTLRQGRNDEARSNSKSRSHCIQAEERLRRPCIGEPGSRRKTTSRRWLALSMKSFAALLNYYYAELGRQRLKKLLLIQRRQSIFPTGPGAACGEQREGDAVGSSFGRSAPAEGGTAGDGGLVDFAARDCRRLPVRIRELGYRRNGPALHRYRTLRSRDQVMKRSTPNYFALDIPDLPRSYWEALFPSPTGTI